MGLAEYHGSELAKVTPCTQGEEVTSVIDHLDELEHRLAERPTNQQPTITQVAEE